LHYSEWKDNSQGGLKQLMTDWPTQTNRPKLLLYYSLRVDPLKYSESKMTKTNTPEIDMLHKSYTKIHKRLERK